MNRLVRPGPPPVELVARSTGSGRRALVLLHGFPFDHTMWSPQLRDLEARMRILAPDLRGLGKSGLDPETGASLHTPAQDVLAWMDSEGIERAAVGGLSMGGYLAFELWRQAPHRVAELALFDTKAEADSEEAKGGRVAASEEIRRGGMAAVAEGMISRVLGSTTRARRPAVVEHVRRMMLSTNPEGALAALDALRTRPSSVADCPRISIPVLVVVGEEDVLTPVGVAQEMAASIPRAELRVVKEAGHVTSLESPEVVTRALRDLVDRSFPELNR